MNIRLYNNYFKKKYYFCTLIALFYVLVNYSLKSKYFYSSWLYLIFRFKLGEGWFRYERLKRPLGRDNYPTFYYIWHGTHWVVFSINSGKELGMEAFVQPCQRQKLKSSWLVKETSSNREGQSTCRGSSLSQ